MTFDLFKAYYGRDDEFMRDRYEYWKEVSSWENESK